MRFVLAAAVCAAAFAFATPASAQATGASASGFSVMVDKKPIPNLRSLEFAGTPPTQIAAGRGGANGSSFTLKATLTRTADRTFDDWIAEPKSLRSVRVNLMDRAGKPTGSIDLDDCGITNWTWGLDAASNALATETWTPTCQQVRRT